MAGTILLWLLANDSVRKVDAGEFSKPVYRTYNAQTATIEEQFNYYSSLDNNVKFDFSGLIDERLRSYDKYFKEGTRYISDYRFINSEGSEKLRKEWPEIWKEFDLDSILL